MLNITYVLNRRFTYPLHSLLPRTVINNIIMLIYTIYIKITQNINNSVVLLGEGPDRKKGRKYIAMYFDYIERIKWRRSLRWRICWTPKEFSREKDCSRICVSRFIVSQDHINIVYFFSSNAGYIEN